MDARGNKYTYLWIVQGRYEYSWKDLTASEDRREMQLELNRYRNTDSFGIFRLVHRRVLASEEIS